MEHPFFDAITFPWHLEEAEKLRTVLAQSIKTPNDIDIEYRKAGDNLPELNLTVAIRTIWADALENLTNHNVLRRFCELIKEKTQNIKKVIELIESISPPSEVKIINDRICILDCENHRRAISDCTSDIIAKVLLIRGGTKSGKSYCRHIVEAIARYKNATVVYLYDGMITTLDEAIMSIFSALGTGSDKIPPQLSTDDAWYRAVCLKLQEIATAQGQKIWIIADDLGYDKDGGSLLDPKIRMFFEQFALFFKNPSFNKCFRLVLINYAEQGIPTKWEADMWAEEYTDENTIQQNHVEDFIKHWVEYKKINIPENSLKTVVADIMNQTQTPPLPLMGLSRLERINKILTLKLAEIQNLVP